MLKKVSKIALVAILIMTTCLAVNPISANTEKIPVTKVEQPTVLVAKVEIPKSTKRLGTSDKELNCLALNIYFESRGESILGQKAVAWVTLNRVKSKKYPNTICGVVYQKGQFSWTFDGLSDRPRNKKQWEVAKKLAKMVTNEFERGRIDPTKGSTMFHAAYVKPQWRKKFHRVLRIDNHIFYR